MKESDAKLSTNWSYPFGRIQRHVQALEWRILVALALIAAGMWLFTELADVVFDDEPAFQAVDEAVILALREPGELSDPVGPPAVETAVRDLTALGGTAILTLLTVNSAVILWLHGNRRSAVVLVLAVIGGTLLSLAFKDLYARPRPSVVPVDIHLVTYSFPSGHSMLSAITYLTIGTLLARATTRRSIKIYIMFLSILLAVAVGFSRVYLGVHWPTDVLAGWTAGIVWALFVWLVANFWSRYASRKSQKSLNETTR